MKRFTTAQAGEAVGSLACRAWRLICSTNAHVRLCIVAVCDHAIACRKLPMCKKNVYLKGGAGHALGRAISQCVLQAAYVRE